MTDIKIIEERQEESCIKIIEVRWEASCFKSIETIEKGSIV